LVVIAIISILAGLLLPALEEALASARKMACANNLRQVTLSAQVYADEAGDWFPVTVIFDTSFPVSRQWWFWPLYNLGYLQDANTLMCPDRVQSGLRFYYAGNKPPIDGPHYWQNYFAGYRDTDGTWHNPDQYYGPYRRGQADLPSNTVLHCGIKSMYRPTVPDWYCQWGGVSGGDAIWVAADYTSGEAAPSAYAHAAGPPASFVDGHCQFGLGVAGGVQAPFPEAWFYARKADR